MKGDSLMIRLTENAIEYLNSIKKQASIWLVSISIGPFGGEFVV